MQGILTERENLHVRTSLGAEPSLSVRVSRKIKLAPPL